MVFSSTVFLFLFLPIALSGYYLIRKELRNSFLLVISLLFYAAGEPKFVFVMTASIMANYLLGILLSIAERYNKFLSRILLILAIGINLGILFFYKYYDFAITNLNIVAGTELPLRHVTLPIGISFFTFQGMSYVLDIYMGKSKIQKNPLNVALYIALFPQLIAGPIVRYSDINQEIESRKESLDDFASGVQRFIVGLAKKVILSNQFGLLADQAFGTAPGQLGTGLAWLGAVAYTLQIYFDFSGYSDMAIGLGRMFGFHFKENFDYPYTASSVTVFWRKWHISLSSWFRDYVYIPLGGNRKGNVYLHLLTVFFLTGLWHGASWNFVVWGLWHGMFLIIERVLRNRKIEISVPKAIKWLYTMLVVVIGWVFFRAADLSSALSYLKCMFIFSKEGIPMQFKFYLKEYFIVFLLSLPCCTPIALWFNKYCDIYVVLNRIRGIVLPIIQIFIFLTVVGVLSVTTYNPFIYFNF